MKLQMSTIDTFQGVGNSNKKAQEDWQLAIAGPKNAPATAAAAPAVPTAAPAATDVEVAMHIETQAA